MRRSQQRKINRSGKAICPICNQQKILVEHHIRGREIHNPNHPSNLANVCSNCHREVHEGLVILEGYMMTTVGMALFWHKKGEESFSGNDATPHIIGS